MAERQNVNALMTSSQDRSFLLIDGGSKKRKQFSDLANLVVKPSSALERMKMFLPHMAAANSDMDVALKLNPTSYNMEDVEDVDGPIIEMNVALVNFEDEKEEKESSDVDSGASVDDSSTDSDSEDDSQSDKPSVTEKNFRIKLEPRRRRPASHSIIKVLGSMDVDSLSSQESLRESSASDNLDSIPSLGSKEECCCRSSSNDDSSRFSISATGDEDKGDDSV